MNLNCFGVFLGGGGIASYLFSRILVVHSCLYQTNNITKLQLQNWYIGDTIVLSKCEPTSQGPNYFYKRSNISLNLKRCLWPKIQKCKNSFPEKRGKTCNHNAFRVYFFSTALLSAVYHLPCFDPNHSQLTKRSPSPPHTKNPVMKTSLDGFSSSVNS